MLQTALPIVAPPMPCPEPASPSGGAEPSAAPGGRFAQALRDAGAPDANTEPVRADAGDTQRLATRRQGDAAEENAAVERRPTPRGPGGARRDGGARTGDTPPIKPATVAAAETAGDTDLLAAARIGVEHSAAAQPTEAEDAATSAAVADPTSLVATGIPLAIATPATPAPMRSETTADGAAPVDDEPTLLRRGLDSAPRNASRAAHAAHTTRDTPTGDDDRGKAIEARSSAFVAPEPRTEQSALTTTPHEVATCVGRDTPDMAAAPLPGAALARFDNTGGAARAAVAPQATLDAPVTSREFAPALGAQVAVWVRDGVQEARLQLHPAELGPLAIQIALDGHSAQIDFHAAHALTRDAIEASLPALAASLRESGFTLAGGGVFGQGAGGASSERGGASAQDARALPQQSSGESAVAATLPEPRTRGWRRGLLDVFA